MLTPGDNLLSEAFECINTHPVTYLKEASRQLNSVGVWVTSYDPGVVLEASVQAVNRNTYTQYNLDFQREYFTVYVCTDVTDLGRDRSGGAFDINGIRYQIESKVPWFEYDGWVGVTVVRV